MSLKPEMSLGVGLALGTAVIAIHQISGPSLADIRTLEPDNKDVDRAEKSATWMSAGLVSVVSLMARDPMIFIVGGAMTVAMAVMNRHANAVAPIMSMLPIPGAAGSANTQPSSEISAELKPYQMFENEFAR
jgi:hypothetical protein